MTKKRGRLAALCVAAAGGCLLSGPCGVTTLQLQDFATSSLIRTSVITVATVLEAALIQSATNPGDGGG